MHPPLTTTNLRFTLTTTLLLLYCMVQAQQFWLTTYEFPGGPKTAIALKGDSTLFVATATGIIRSYNQANKFDTCFTNPDILSLLVTANQSILAGGIGKIYRSTNNGQTWDSAVLNNNYGIMQLLQLPNGHLFAISAALDLTFNGGGVYYSDNDGATWVQRNTGLGNYLFMDGLAADKNNRLYVTSADALSTGNAGLFYSDNEGQQWNHVDITFDGKNSVTDALQVTRTRGLTVAPNDSLYFSFEGIADNTGVQVNLRKHVNDVTGNSQWQQDVVSNSNMFWMDKVLGNIHIAQNGDRYSSNANTQSTGGTFFRKSNTYKWDRHDEGLGLDIYQRRNWHQFAETSTGRIFMIQYLDERIYVTDTSRYTPTALPDEQLPAEATVYPNPVGAGNTVYVQFVNNNHRLLTLTDVTGRVITRTSCAANEYTLIAPEKKGLYLVTVNTGHSNSTKRIIVY